ncbi:4Fe-4S dicluster domain-containing protein [Methanococcus aeolicus]|jgi:4Fe-4S ferredoxin|uniref:4Fe-4S ferredoxin iron-sulfur binding domain protein n=1 Tax=Methanococcus aeolicus (strain ATCC BAA-1280 / DSM 17508 / OCM 812 / Nankai-3) TaxID=419665 RepID=A6UUP7_META3|nr:4Fe-4S dicluster domain-containing protein [Methanococcus aeolicus]ABR56219.1 4Fe-4S ferredoxin iron-sulfur binding domain protein [Methanococcus aeolicus Nankai-3]UXM84230.1 helix-turn-helix domain-containing protein [Methanococcus aeolicus]
MPEHILSGIKAIIAIKLKKEGKLQREIAEYLKIDRSAVSHYVNGRYPSEKVLAVANEIVELPIKQGIFIINTLSRDKELTNRIIKNIYGDSTAIEINSDTCILCGGCLECEYDAISINNTNYLINIDNKSCVLCGKCLKICPEHIDIK